MPEVAVLVARVFVAGANPVPLDRVLRQLVLVPVVRAGRVALDEQTLDDMYRIMALANYEDRYVIPTNHREYAGKTPFDNEIAFEHRSSCGFSFGNGCSDGTGKTSLFGNPTHRNTMSGKGQPK